MSSASQICTFIYIQYLQSEQFRIGAVWKYWVHFFSHSFHFPLFQIPQSRWISFFYLLSVWENVNLQEINLYLCYCCLLTTVCPAVSLRRKTCVLWQSDSVFLMAYCLWTKKLNSVFSVALLPVFFYTQQVLFY